MLATKIAILCTPLLIAASAAIPQELVSKSDLKITLGSVSETRSGFLKVDGPKERAQLKAGNHKQALLQFRYRGPSQNISELNSDTLRRQIGLKLRTKNSCNVLYVMWRIEPEEKVFVELKRNPGKTTHEDCGTQGYKKFEPISLSNTTATDQRTHRLYAHILEKASEYSNTR